VELSTRSITLKLLAQSSDSVSGVFRRIRRIPPGSYWKITSSGIEEKSFWSVFDDVDPDRLARDDERTDVLIEKLDALLQHSVAIHCISDAPLATACSGGIDSGLVTVFAKRHVPDYHGYVVDPDTGVNEREAAERTGICAGVEIRPVSINREIYLRNMPNCVFHMESDIGLVSTPALYEMTQQCKHDGIKVLLTGEGSDELFGGYGWHAQSAKPWRRLDYPWRILMSTRRQRRVRNRLAFAPLFHSMGSANHGERHAILRGLSPRLNFVPSRLMEHLRPVPRHYERAAATAGLYDLQMHLQNLLHRHDRLSMAASVELRVPFLENDIIDFALHLLPRYKIRKGKSKWLLRSVAEKYLPKQNVTAPKLGFPLTYSYTQGCEKILLGGWLADILEWSREELDDMIEYASTEGTARLHLVGMELLARQFGNGEKAEELGEELIGLSTSDR